MTKGKVWLAASVLFAAWLVGSPGHAAEMPMNGSTPSGTDSAPVVATETTTGSEGATSAPVQLTEQQLDAVRAGYVSAEYVSMIIKSSSRFCKTVTFNGRTYTFAC